MPAPAANGALFQSAQRERSARPATLLKTILPYWKSLFTSRVGDPEKDEELLRAEQIVSALEKNGQHVVCVVYGNEGHGFARPENRIDCNARTEKFLAEHLGGRFEPMKGDRIPGSTAIVKEIGKKTAAR